MQDKKAIIEGVRTWWLKNIIGLVLVGAVLLLASGKLNWWIAWIYLAAMVLIMIANAIAMDPSLLVERSELQEGTKKWDVALASFVAIWEPMSIWIIAGLDNRFGWPQISLPSLQVVAFIFFLLGSLIGTWAMSSNRYFSATVRIQKDRNHQVVTTGPYRYVRHPGYVGGIIAMLMTSFALGSLVAQIPSFLVASGFVLRTSLEDKVLQKELVGYKEYAKEIRYRLFPMIW
jgi:protein-S-isoprenylcysteine O-methyltransferase Ste14